MNLHITGLRVDEDALAKLRKATDLKRPPSSQRGYDAQWNKDRVEFLKENPYCGCGKKSKVVDHIKPHKGNNKLFMSKKNRQAMCFTCHNRKTASSDGGFGRKVNSIKSEEEK